VETVKDTVNWLRNGTVAEKAVFVGAFLVFAALVGFTVIEIAA